MATYQELFKVEPSLAYTSLTLLQGERTYATSPSIASEVLLNTTIPAVSHRLVGDVWAEKILAYKDIVEVEYSANYIDSDSYVRAVEDQSETHFVHYLIEPNRLTYEQYGSRFLSNLEVNANVTDLNGTTVYQYERTIPNDFNQDQMDNIRNQLFSFQDMCPLVEAAYRRNPESLKFARDFCMNLYNLKEYQKVKVIARPFLDRPKKQEFYAILG